MPLNFRSQTIWAILLCGVLLFGCSRTRPLFVSVEAFAPDKEIVGPIEYTIGQQDVLSITVWRWPDLTTETIVRPDGKISFPLVGDIVAEGLTLTELDNILTERLKEYIKDPEVSVVLTQFGGRKVIILGEVIYPGVYRPTGNSSVLEVLAFAQGFTDDAVLGSVILIRGAPQHPKGTRLNLSRAIDQLDMKQNPIVQDGDIIYVPKKFIANVNYFMDQILNPLTKSASFTEEMRTHKPNF